MQITIKSKLPGTSARLNEVGEKLGEWMNTHGYDPERDAVELCRSTQYSTTDKPTLYRYLYQLHRSVATPKGFHRSAHSEIGLGQHIVRN